MTSKYRGVFFAVEHSSQQRAHPEGTSFVFESSTLNIKSTNPLWYGYSLAGMVIANTQERAVRDIEYLIDQNLDVDQHGQKL